MLFGRLSGESTSAWLGRLVEIGAPADIRANVMSILDNETKKRDTPAGISPTLPPISSNKFFY
jgi:hypothetical protein